MAQLGMHQIEDWLADGMSFRLLNLVKRSPWLARAAWRTLRWYQDISGAAPDVYAQLRETEPAATPAPQGRRVLVFSLRGWAPHLAWETTLARALHLRGAQTLTILCDRILPACEPRTSVDDFDSTCERCHSHAARFLPATGLPYRWLSDFVSPAERAGFRSQTAGLFLADLATLTADGVPIGELVAASVNRHLLQARVDDSPEYLAAYRRFVSAGLTVHAAAGRLLTEYRPDVVFMMNGVFYAEAIVSALARARGMAVWSYERAKKVDGLIFAKDVPVIKQDFVEPWRDWAPRVLTAEQDAKLDEYLQVRASGNVGIERLWQDMRGQASTGVAPSQPTAVLFTNVLWDTAVHQSDIGFASMADWVIATLQWFAAHAHRRLVVRVHPAEVRVPFKASRDPLAARLAQAFPVLPSNVRLVPPEDTLSSYALLDGAAVVLVYSSTIGLEAAVRGIPTLVAGKTHYRGKGFTVDVDTAAAYALTLDEAFACGRLTQQAVALARRYAYFYFFDQIIPFPLVHEWPRSYVTLRYRCNDDLRPGRDAALDMICSALLDGGPLSNPSA